MPKEMLLLNSKKKEPSSPLLIRVTFADKTQKQNNYDLTILSPKRSSGKKLQCKWGTQVFSTFLLCHPQIMASTVKVPLGSRWLLEHLPSPGTRKEEAGKDKWDVSPLRSLPKSSTCKLQLSLWPEIFTCSQLAARESGKCGLQCAHCHPDIHQGSFPEGRGQKKIMGSNQLSLIQSPPPNPTTIITILYQTPSILHTLAQFVPQ